MTRRGRGISSAVASMVIILGILLSVMIVSSGCSAEDAISAIADGNPFADPDDIPALSGSDVSFSDAAISHPEDQLLEIPKDHEDVVFANYVSDYYIVVYTLNCSVLILGKDENGRYNVPIKTFMCSTGSFENNTVSNNGVYDIVEKLDWRFMMDVYGHYCTRIGKGTGYLFHSVPYKDERDLRSQSGLGYDNLGKNVSHGCIRLCSRDAKWIYDNIPFGTQVRIVDGKNGPPGEPIPMRIHEPKYYGWDPTDPNSNNPYNQLDPSELTYFTHTSAPTDTTTAATKPTEGELFPEETSAEAASSTTATSSEG